MLAYPMLQLTSCTWDKQVHAVEIVPIVQHTCQESIAPDLNSGQMVGAQSMCAGLLLCFWQVTLQPSTICRMHSQATTHLQGLAAAVGNVGGPHIGRQLLDATLIIHVPARKRRTERVSWDNQRQMTW